jgi:hypothetical protein
LEHTGAEEKQEIDKMVANLNFGCNISFLVIDSLSFGPHEEFDPNIKAHISIALCQNLANHNVGQILSRTIS